MPVNSSAFPNIIINKFRCHEYHEFGICIPQICRFEFGFGLSDFHQSIICLAEGIINSVMYMFVMDMFIYCRMMQEIINISLESKQTALWFVDAILCEWRKYSQIFM